MKIIYLNNRVFDVFFGDGWKNNARIRKTDIGYIILRKHVRMSSGKLLDIIETSLLMREV